ncbi:MAG: hydrogenase maturation nickel metallochaperone HypA [Polyangia bacterium]
MHEHAILRSLMKEITRIAAAEGARRVTAVHVHLGALSHLTEEHFREHFAIESRGTPAEGAALSVEVGQDPLAADALQVVLRSLEVQEAPAVQAVPEVEVDGGEG